MTGEAHTKVRLVGQYGSVGSAFEHFSTGFALKHGGDFVANATQDAIVAAITAFWARAASKIGNAALLQEVRFAHVDATGKQDQVTRVVTMAQAGGGRSSIEHPPQVAWAVSLQGPVGLHRVRGRMYLPNPCVDISGSTGTVGTTDAQALRGSFVTLVNAVNAAGTGVQMGIDTKTGVVPVTRIRVGHALDTIRSRRRSLAETYEVGTIVGGDPSPS